jgi:cytochrome P450 / NADPH-cytochrome P450 reductase
MVRRVRQRDYGVEWHRPGRCSQYGQRERLDDVNIRYQIITFLIAGHETTSGLLSFALYFLLNNPDALTRAYEEVDRVLGDDLSSPPTNAQVNHLRYVSQVLKETLRLWPTAPAFTRHAYEDTALCGKYQVGKQDSLMVLTPMLHRDPKIWGEDAEIFDPERFTQDAEQTRPANAYKPFGTGQRACIGRQFAMLEATLVLGMILQRFELVDHTNYELKIRQTLTIKPADFRIKVRARTDARQRSRRRPPHHPSRKKNPRPSRLRRCRAARRSWSSSAPTWARARV